jgi:hypothetical protein
MGIIVEIDEKQAERLRALTHQEDLAAAVAEALARFVDDREEGRLQAWEVLLGGAGMGGGPVDGADRHDHYLYEVQDP